MRTSDWINVALGIALIIFGILFFIAPFATITGFVRFLGIFWIITGVFTIFSLIDEERPWGWKILKGIVDIALGIIVLSYPYMSALILPTTMVIILGIWGIIMGAAGIVQGIGYKESLWILLGILSITLSIVILASPKVSAVFLITLCAVMTIPAGVILVSNAVRRAEIEERVRRR